MSLATKYRPTTFDDIMGQDSIKKTLEKQLELKRYSNCYLFYGPSGTGKTTLAKILANRINNGAGAPIEIDAASNNGVDNIRNITTYARERSLDSEYKIYIIDECVTGDTEVLTDSGWKRFDSLDKTEKIAQYKEDGTIEFVAPIEYIEKDYTGDMYNIKIGNKAVFTMSPNHVQPLYYPKSNKVKEAYVKDIKINQTNKFIRSGHGVGHCDKLSTDDRLVIALQADGHLQNNLNTHNYWTIKIKKARKKLLLENLLCNSSFEYKEIKSGSEDDSIVRYSIKTPKNVTKKLNTYFNLDNMSYEYARDFISELMNWDGYVQSDKYYYYSCVDKDNVDFCQCVGILGGYRSRTGIEHDNRSDNFNDVHRLYLMDEVYSSSNSHISKERIDFTGKIYCVKVPSHMIIIRKNGYEMVTGNCHMITTAGWNAFLKCIEEPPKYTIFIFCTTDQQKIPATINNRVMRFNLTRLSNDMIISRLKKICELENIMIEDDSALDHIAKISNGSMRTAIANLERVAALYQTININNVLSSLGNYSYDIMFNIVNSIIDHNSSLLVNSIDDLYTSGKDIKLFVDALIDFTLDVTKYCIFKDFSIISIPKVMEKELNYTSLVFDNSDNNSRNIKYFSDLSNKLIELRFSIRYDQDTKTTVEASLLNLCVNN